MSQALHPTKVVGEITWLGIVADSEKSLRSRAVDSFELTFAGQQGECHAGLTRKSDSRVLLQFPRGTEVRNVRQLSILSEEELDLIAKRMGVDRVNPSWVGASMVVRGIPDFTHVPPSSRLQTSTGTTLCIDMENRPCIYPGKVIEEDVPGHGKKFKLAAKGLRGVTAWVEREGSVNIGDSVTLHIPDQRPWKDFYVHSTQVENEENLVMNRIYIGAGFAAVLAILLVMFKFSLGMFSA